MHSDLHMQHQGAAAPQDDVIKRLIFLSIEDRCEEAGRLFSINAPSNL